MNYRSLTNDEIVALEARGCRSNDWGLVQVADPFEPSCYRNAVFSGQVRLGTTGKTHLRSGCIPVRSGIYDALLHECTVGNDVLIRKINNYICRYDIGDDVIIENVGRVAMTGESTFGNGTEVSVLNETGGREVPIYDRLSAHVAYLLAMYRHDTALMEALRGMVRDYTEARRSDRGRVETGARIINSGSIQNVYIGPCAVIDGASKLFNGSLMSEPEAPVYIGANVLASDFILAAGSHLDDGAVVVHSYIGQGSELSRLFSAHDSLFFANCLCENGEACAIFAGPYTVTMHKSSLLIAGMFSFLNAGSGSNQSNHMYKLGPIHQGIVERGSKTTSDSYILWPARIGAFSLVMGRHVNHPDTSRLPFSYLIEKAGESHIVPGVNLKSVGTVRDAQKWPKRDRRTTLRPLDFINFNLLSPYTVSKMMDGCDLLHAIEETSGATSQVYTYQGLTLTASALRKGIDYYGMAIDKFMGNSVIKRLEGMKLDSDADIRRALSPDCESGSGEWVDLCGLIAPKTEIRRLTADIAEGRIKTLDEIEERLCELHSSYYRMEWTWVAEHFERWWGKPMEALTAADIHAIVDRWTRSVTTLDRLLYDDARKEFSSIARIGFGQDGSDRRGERDFEHVRGEFEKDAFVLMVLDHIKKKTALGEELKSRLC